MIANIPRRTPPARWDTWIEQDRFNRATGHDDTVVVAIVCELPHDRTDFYEFVPPLQFGDDFMRTAIARWPARRTAHNQQECDAIAREFTCREGIHIRALGKGLQEELAEIATEIINSALPTN